MFFTIPCFLFFFPPQNLFIEKTFYKISTCSYLVYKAFFFAHNFIFISFFSFIFSYGFIHTEALPAKSEQEEKDKVSELQREVKWLKMLKKWNKKDTQEKLRKRIFKGVPGKLRIEVGQLDLVLKLFFYG